MITHNNYWLRAVEEDDLTWMKELRNDESTWSQLGNFVFLNEARQKNWFENMNCNNNIEYLVYGYKAINIGIVRLTEIDHINRSMCVGGDILPQHRGKKHAQPMYEIIQKLGFDVWGMNRLWLLVLANNEVGLHVYKKVGFKEEGIQRQAIYKDGKFVDYIMMSILNSEYQK